DRPAGRLARAAGVLAAIPGNCRVRRRLAMAAQKWKALEPDEIFRIFALRLTPGGERLPAETISLLAAWAFLDDIRQYYRARLWRPKTWRLGRRPALVLSRLAPPCLPADDSPDRLEYQLATLFLQVRELPGQAADPLLVVMTGQPRPSFANEEVVIARAEATRPDKPR